MKDIIIPGKQIFIALTSITAAVVIIIIVGTINIIKTNNRLSYIEGKIA